MEAVIFRRILVPEEGVEPTRPCDHRILSPARLPVPPLGHGEQNTIPREPYPMPDRASKRLLVAYRTSHSNPPVFECVLAWYNRRNMPSVALGTTFVGPNAETFKISDFLGQGAFGEVYRSAGETSGTVVAVKLLPLGVLAIPEDKIALLNEI